MTEKPKKKILSDEEARRQIAEMYANAMTLNDFEIGKPFMMSGNKWLCVDKGTWSVIAVRLGEREMTSILTEDGKRTEKKVVYNVTIEDCKGPPYVWGVSVIDEDDFPACKKIEESEE